MKRIVQALFLMISILASSQAVTQKPGANVSQAEQRIVQARRVIAEKPGDHAGYNMLAAALVLRAQETFDATLCSQAEGAVKNSLVLSPNNFETEKIQASILLCEHEYPAALQLAHELNSQIPDDLTVYGLLTDAEIELGDYDDAENSATWMLNLRRGNRPAAILASRLRDLFGDPDGAYEIADLAFQSTVQSEVGERASLLTQMGRYRLAIGNTDAAEKLFRQALTVLPNYPDALGNLAQLRIRQKRYEDAVLLCRQRYQVAPRARNLFYLAEALMSAGREQEARKALDDFEARALAESAHKDNSNLELVFYYADHVHQARKALEVAKSEYIWRHDVWTLDAYAWALHSNGQGAEARKQIEAALAVGVRDAGLLRHAMEICLKLGDRTGAEQHAKQLEELKSLDSESAGIAVPHLSLSER